MKEWRIGFIGAGKVGVALGRYFLGNGVRLRGYLDRDQGAAETAAQKTGASAYLNISQMAADCDIIFITTPDNEIINVWQDLNKADIRDKLICHTSGAVSSAVFSGIKERGACGYSLHPMLAFPDKSGNVRGIERCYFTVEGDGSRLSEITDFITAMGNRVNVIESSRKALYHSANVMVSNLVLALFKIAEDWLISAGFGTGQALPALEPLITNNIANVFQKGLAQALTGPVERNDLNTVKSNLDALPEEYVQIYAGLSLKLIEIAREKHPGIDYSQLESLIKEYITGLEKRN